MDGRAWRLTLSVCHFGLKAPWPWFDPPTNTWREMGTGPPGTFACLGMDRAALHRVRHFGKSREGGLGWFAFVIVDPNIQVYLTMSDS